MDKVKYMSGMIVGFAIGIVVAVFAVAYCGLLRQPVEHQLIDEWRKLQPGMLISDVESILGKSSGHFPLGDRFPEWAERSVPQDFYQKHGLVTYVIMGIGPQVLLIYFDERNRVVFVSSRST